MFAWLSSLFGSKQTVKQLDPPAVANKPAPSPTRFETPYSIAQGYIGEREIRGSNHNNVIVRWAKRIQSWVQDDETSWCSTFVDQCAFEASFERSNNLAARSWLKVGVKVDPKDAQPGDVVIFWRESPDSWKGHVGFLAAKINSQFVPTLGGNQSSGKGYDEVNVSNYGRSRLLGVRRLRSLAQLERSSN